uniref:Uncharacterized protein n=1 Tax=Oryza meridionalis TaxID=40149 RepID=A0A0E0EYM3_9ORYZ
MAKGQNRRGGKETSHLRDDDDVVGEARPTVVRGAVPRGARARLHQPNQNQQSNISTPRRSSQIWTPPGGTTERERSGDGLTVMAGAAAAGLAAGSRSPNMLETDDGFPLCGETMEAPARRDFRRRNGEMPSTRLD